MPYLFDKFLVSTIALSFNATYNNIYFPKSLILFGLIVKRLANFFPQDL